MSSTDPYKTGPDPYKAGPCPTCGKFATNTWRHLGAPVSCNEQHLWFRNTMIKANSSSDKIENHIDTTMRRSK